MSIVIAVLASAFSVASAEASINLLTNGSFETGDFTSWTVLNTSPPPNNAAAVTNAALIDPKTDNVRACAITLHLSRRIVAQSPSARLLKSAKTKAYVAQGARLGRLYPRGCCASGA